VLEVALNRLAGYRAPQGRQRRPIIRSTGTLRIRQVDGLNLSTVIATSPLPTVGIVPGRKSQVENLSGRKMVGPGGLEPLTSSVLP
jgi:hypothetical protein